jgi:hypothetical protein
VLSLKELHDEAREQQKKARANLLEIDPNAILPELSGLSSAAHEFMVFPQLQLHQQHSQIRRFGIRAEMMNWSAFSS